LLRHCIKARNHTLLDFLHLYLHGPGCYDYRSGRLGKYLSFYVLTNFMLKWIWCGFEGSYDDSCLWDI